MPHLNPSTRRNSIQDGRWWEAQLSTPEESVEMVLDVVDRAIPADFGKFMSADCSSRFRGNLCIVMTQK